MSFDDRTLAERIARSAGKMIRDGAAGVTVQLKADGTPVTPVDTAVNQHVMHAIRHHRPHDAVLGEEASFPDSPSGRVWVCDPLDGTWLYGAGIRLSMFSLALVVEGNPVVGVVYDPWTDQMYSAAAGAGATCNGTRISVNDRGGIGGAPLVLPGGRVPLLDAAGLFGDAVAVGADVVTTGSAVRDAMLVAAGFAVGCVYAYTSAWDMAAVAAIVSESGLITDLFGGLQRYDRSIYGAIVSNGTVHDELRELVRPHLAEMP